MWRSRKGLKKLKIHICSLLKSSSGKRTKSYVVYIISYVVPLSINFILPSLKPKKIVHIVHISPWPDFPKDPKAPPNLPQVLIVPLKEMISLLWQKVELRGDLHPPWESWDPPDLTLGVWIDQQNTGNSECHSASMSSHHQLTLRLSVTSMGPTLCNFHPGWPGMIWI